MEVSNRTPTREFEIKPGGGKKQRASYTQRQNACIMLVHKKPHWRFTTPDSSKLSRLANLQVNTFSCVLYIYTRKPTGAINLLDCIKTSVPMRVNVLINVFVSLVMTVRESLTIQWSVGRSSVREKQKKHWIADGSNVVCVL